MSRFQDLDEFIRLFESELNMKNIMKINIKTYFVFMVFKVKEDSREKYDLLDEENKGLIKSQLTPCIYKKR
jgi:hypothetical protein